MGNTNALDNPFIGWTTINDAADIIGRDKEVLRFWAAKGWITCYPVGKKMRVVNIDEVRSFSNKNPGHKKKRELRRKKRLERQAANGGEKPKRPGRV